MHEVLQVVPPQTYSPQCVVVTLQSPVSHTPALFAVPPEQVGGSPHVPPLVAVQVPLEPETLQAWQAVLQAVLQQTLSTHVPCAHGALLEQLSPIAPPVWHMWLMQV